MNMLVCIKQVPDTTEIRIDPVKNTLIRDGVPSIVNPFDAYALEAAARIKDKDPSSQIVLLSMGPEQAKNALKECLAVGGDKAYLVSDRAFGGSDTLATSYILSRAIKKIEETEGKFDIIFCGKQAIDGDTAQVGPEIAEHLGYPQVTYALEVFVDGEKVKVKKEIEEGYEMIGVQTPCVITVTKPSFDPRYPSVKSKLAANRKEIATITSEDISDLDRSKIGLKGSPTKVKKTFTPSVKSGGVKICEDSGSATAKKLFEVLVADGII
ncbi:MAG: electron transfer flavoprotein subunit beta/FixA family protein [Clostridiales bacterium]|nr:electron transfer flavoprotein subunit beta/FixA family protein [Clostridiales bacterium]